MKNITDTITILLPARNEEKLLEKTVKIIQGKNPFRRYTTIHIIENGSTDNTWVIAKNLARKYQDVTATSRRTPGYGPALKEGILTAKSEIIIVFNVDYYDMSFLKKTLTIIRKVDIVLGSKTLASTKDLRPRWRKMITWGFNKLLNLGFGYKGSDTHGMKVMRRSKILPLVRACHPFHWLFDTELILRAQYAGLRICELPVSVVEQRTPVSSILGRILRSAKEILHLWFILHKKS